MEAFWRITDVQKMSEICIFLSLAIAKRLIEETFQYRVNVLSYPFLSRCWFLIEALKGTSYLRGFLRLA